MERAREHLEQMASASREAYADVREGIEQVSHRDWVTKATANAKSAGVQGTPTVLLDGEVFDDGRTVTDLADNLVEAIE
mgnify:CR=1 FL=1